MKWNRAVSVQSMVAVIALCVAAVTEAGKIYRYVDAQGRVFYSDRPISKDADKVVTLKTINKLATQVAGGSSSSVQETSDRQGFRVTVISPTANTTIPTGQRSLTVSARVEPTPESSVQYQLWMDGAKIQSAVMPRFTMRQLTRGSHQLQVKAVDPYHRTLAESEPVEIHVIRARVAR